MLRIEQLIVFLTAGLAQLASRCLRRRAYIQGRQLRKFFS